ncbi:MAG: amino acid ABC transporter permease [Clostridia bacterium]|nr:amino acid ABC transporter permease [Clostridia bacterium]
MINNILSGFFDNVVKIFTEKSYISSIADGLETTITVSLGAALLGLIIGTLVTFVKILPEAGWKTKVAKVICNIYVTIIRGTPVALQLFIAAFVIFNFRGFPPVVTAIFAFGVNSGAYVSENFRAGICSVDKGQSEAGRALGLSFKTTLLKIVFPQAIKNVIPAIGNELIALVKETSIVSMIGMFDLTMAAKVIGSGQNLASYFAPMAVVAVCYLAIVYLITLVIKLLERRLSKNDRG